MVLFYIDTPRSGAPACSASAITWTIDATTPAGQTQAASLITALAANLPIDVGDTGVCQYSGAEAINFINIYR